MQGEQGRYKGVRKDDGKIIKGTLKEAPLKLKASSIPSKTENIIYSNHHKSAFGNSQERFYTPINQKTEQTPGPGNYNPLALANRIQSKKGSGSFASATKLTRFNEKRNWNPGPGRYDFSLNKSKRAKSTYQFTTHSQVRDLFKNELKTAGNVPGPGDYEEGVRHQASTYNSIFKSNVNRFRMSNTQTPPVGFYKWEEKKRKVFSLKFGQQPSKVDEKNVSTHYRYMDNLVGKKLQPSQMLGPGKYSPNIMQTSKGFTIKQNNHDRFGTIKQKFAIQAKVQAQPELVVPKQNESVVFKGNPHSSVFKSKSKRYEFGQYQKDIIGDPGKYSPTKLAQQSHLINFGQKWV